MPLAPGCCPRALVFPTRTLPPLPPPMHLCLTRAPSRGRTPSSRRRTEPCGHMLTALLRQPPQCPPSPQPPPGGVPPAAFQLGPAGSRGLSRRQTGPCPSAPSPVEAPRTEARLGLCVPRLPRAEPTPPFRPPRPRRGPRRRAAPAHALQARGCAHLSLGLGVLRTLSSSSMSGPLSLGFSTSSVSYSRSRSSSTSGTCSAGSCSESRTCRDVGCERPAWGGGGQPPARGEATGQLSSRHVLQTVGRPLRLQAPGTVRGKAVLGSVLSTGAQGGADSAGRAGPLPREAKGRPGQVSPPSGRAPVPRAGPFSGQQSGSPWHAASSCSARGTYGSVRPPTAGPFRQRALDGGAQPAGPWPAEGGGRSQRLPRRVELL